VLFASLGGTSGSSSGNQRLGEIAGHLGADHFVIGAVSGARSRVRLLAALYAQGRPDSAIATAVTEGDASSIPRLVDKLASQLLAGSFPERRVRLTGVESATSSSEAALSQYLRGEDALRAGRDDDAVASFQRATQLDTGFALAYYRLAVAAAGIDGEALAAAATDMAARFDSRLSARDASLVDAAVAIRRGDLARAGRLYRDAVARYPDDVEAWLQYGELLFHHRPLRGKSASDARAAYEHILAVDPLNTSALLHLVRIATLEGRAAEVDSLRHRLLTRGSGADVLALGAVRAFAIRADSVGGMVP
jgi:tetratricopeptide (TPR) repeat protein